jgi:hypothetical protein
MCNEIQRYEENFRLSQKKKAGDKGQTEIFFLRQIKPRKQNSS